MHNWLKGPPQWMQDDRIAFAFGVIVILFMIEAALDIMRHIHP